MVPRCTCIFPVKQALSLARNYKPITRVQDLHTFASSLGFGRGKIWTLSKRPSAKTSRSAFRPSSALYSCPFCAPKIHKQLNQSQSFQIISDRIAPRWVSTFPKVF